MTARTLTIDPFELPDGSNPEVEVTISLVDSNNRRIQGLEVISGQPIIDRVTVLVYLQAQTVDLWPQPELVPVIGHGTPGDQTTTYYLVDIVHTSSRYRLQVRIQARGNLFGSE